LGFFGLDWAVELFIAYWGNLISDVYTTVVFTEIMQRLLNNHELSIIHP
jgi:hypothetical protein